MVSRERQATLLRVETHNLTLHPVERKMGLEIEFNHQWQMMEAIIPTWWSLDRNLNIRSLGSFWVDEYFHVLGGWCCQKSHGNSPPPPSLTLLSASLLFLGGIRYNKMVVISIALFWVLQVVLVNYWTWWEGEQWGNPEFVAKLGRSTGSLRTWDLLLVSEGRTVFWGWALKPVESDTNSR